MGVVIQDKKWGSKAFHMRHFEFGLFFGLGVPRPICFGDPRAPREVSAHGVGDTHTGWIVQDLTLVQNASICRL